MACQHFWTLFKSELSSGLTSSPKAKFPRWENADLSTLRKPFIAEEVHTALFDMQPYKAPDLDGFQPLFYEKLWPMVRSTVI